MSFDSGNNSEVTQTPPHAAPGDGPPPARLSEEGLDLLRKSFDQFDDNKSGDLDKDELLDAVYGENKTLGSTAHLLWQFTHAVGSLAANDNTLNLSTKVTRDAFDDKFGSDTKGEGVSKKDIDVMRWTLDKNATDDYLASLRRKEYIAAITGAPNAVGLVATGVALQFVPSFLTNVAGIGLIGAGGLLGKSVIGNVTNSGIPKYSQYIKETRELLEDFKKGSPLDRIRAGNY